MSTKEKLHYSSIGFCSIMDDEKHILWSVNKRLFRKIASDKAFIDAQRKLKDDWDTFICYITYEGVNFRIKAFHLPEGRFLCIAFPEECYIRYAYSEMYMRIFNIRKNANRCIASMNDVQDILVKSGVDSNTLDYIRDCIAFSEEIMNDSVSISQLFDLEHMCDYVDLNEKLGAVCRNVKKYNSVMKSRVSINVNLERSVARMNYNIFETALFEVVRILYKILPDDKESVIEITDGKDGNIIISADASIRSGFDVSTIDTEVRDIKCMFECLGGGSEVITKIRKMHIKAFVHVSLSNYKNRVRPEGYFGDHYEELKGYSRIIEPYEGPETDELVFNSPHLEFKVDFSDIMSDIMFSSLISE